MTEKIKKFITDNGLTFEEGRRNSDLTVICGYGLYLGVFTEGNVLEILHEVLEPLYRKDKDLEDECTRVFLFAKSNNYQAWWSEESNRAKFKLDA